MICLYTRPHMQRAILTVDTNDNNSTDTNSVASSHVSRMVRR